MDEFRKEVAFRRRVRLPTKLLHLLIRGDREVIRHGVRWRLDYNESRIHQRIIKNSCYEPEEVKHFFSEAARRNCEIFLDIGANIGLYSVLGARMGIFKEIHALEPVAKNFSRLQWHIQNNGLDDSIRTYQLAASDSAREAVFINEAADSGGWKMAKTEATASSNPSCNVQTEVLDSLFGWENKNLAVKMDVEWHEMFVLRGAESLFAKNRVFLQVEITSDNTAVINYLLDRGFRMLTYISGKNFYFDNTADTN